MKKTLCIIIAFVMLIGNISAIATEYNDSDIASLLSELGIMSGDPDGNLRLNDSVTRAEFSKIAIAGSVYRNSVATNSAISPFKDVQYTHWAAPYVKLAVTNGIITGYPDSTFRPENTVTYEEAVTICLKLLGYTAEDFGVSWPYGQTGMAANLKLNKNVEKGIGENMTRRDVMHLVYNLLNTASKNSNTDYITVFDYTIVEDCVITASPAEDSSVGSGKVSTSAGIYSVNENFDYSNIGKKGDLVLKENKELVIFIPSQQIITEYTIQQVLENDLVVYHNGVPSNDNIDTSMTVYNKSSKSTLKSMLSSINAGDILVTYKNSNGVLDYGMLKTDTLQGPYIAYSSEWYKGYGLDIGQFTVTRDGVRVNATDISMYDVVYYSPALKTVWAYSKKITGIYESASPNKDMPTSVTVSGVEYKLEGVNAYNELSSNGSFNYGDTVTLLMGRNGDVAGVMSPESSSGTVTGYLTGAGTKQFVTNDGNNISSYYVTIVRADGTQTDFRTSHDHSGFLNSIVTLSFNNEGVASIGVKKDSSGLYGKVDAKNNTIGKQNIAQNVNILDISTRNKDEVAASSKVYLSRIDGLELDENDIAYYTKNSKGEISEIFLLNFTGDIYKYGVVLSADTNEYGSLTGFTAISDWSTLTYKKDVIGGLQLISGSASGVQASSGAGIAMTVNGKNITSFKSLSKLSGQIKSIVGNVITTQNGTYELAGNASAFVSTSGTYMQTTIDEVADTDKYYVSAYYDKLPEKGGRIRVLVAKAK